MSTRPADAPVMPDTPPAPAAPRKPPRLPFIDGLRGLAILLVLVYHAWVHPVGEAILLPLPGFDLDVTSPAYFGFAGVRLFVVLSGFCLMYPLAHGELRVDLGRFWRRRAWRILPPYYIALALFVLLRILTDRPTEAGNVITHLLLIHNLFPQWMGSINGAWWTLALEGQFYLTFPLLVVGFRRWGIRNMLFATLVVSLGWRTWAWHTHDMNSLNIAYYWCYALPGRLFSFALGMAAALVLARHKSMLTAPWLRGYALGIVGFAALAVCVVSQWSRFAPVADILWGLTFYCVVMFAATRNALGAPIFTWRPLAWVGGISYSIYLLHDPLIQQSALLVRPLGWSPLVTWIVFEVTAVPLSIAIGWLYYRWVESCFVGRCPEFRWPEKLRIRILAWVSVFSRRGVSEAQPAVGYGTGEHLSPQ